MESRSIEKTAALVVFIIATIFLIIFLIIKNMFFVSSLHEKDPLLVPSEVLESPVVEYTEAVEQARLLSRTLIVDENLPGLSVAIAVNDELVWAEGFGWADLKEGTPISPFTQFRIGSTAIPLTAAAVGLLYERDLLDLDIPVQEYVPSFPKKEWEISTRQLMGHVSGILPYQGEEDMFSRVHYETVTEGVKVFASYPLRFNPSTDFKYSVYGWVLVGAAIESAAAEPYINFMEREIFKPLDMKYTVPDSADNIILNRASLYWPTLAMNTHYGLEDAFDGDLSSILPAGGFVSTPMDLVKFGMAMLDGSLLEPETVEILQTVQKLTSGKPTGSGLGWQVSKVSIGNDSSLTTMFSAPGSSTGGTTSFITFPEQRMVIAVVTNVSYAKGLSPFAVSLARLFNQDEK